MTSKTNFVETAEYSRNVSLSAVPSDQASLIAASQKLAAAQFAVSTEISTTIKTMTQTGTVEETRETLIIQSKKENASVNSRPLSDALQTLVLEKRRESRAEAPAREKNVALQAQPIQFEATTDLPVIYALNYHFIQNYSYLDSTIQFEDGSIWQLSPGDIYAVPAWWADDILIVTPNHFYDPIFNPYKYCITNQRTATYVLANLAIGPDLFSPYIHHVLAVDYLFGRVYLDDGSYWEVDDEDYYLLQYWNAGDVIIVGDNDDDFFYGSILINVTVNEYIRAEVY